MKINGKFIFLKKMNLSDANFIYSLRKKKMLVYTYITHLKLLYFKKNG